MSVKKIVIAKGTYQEEESKVLISFDEAGNSIDIINIDRLLVGHVFEARIEKLLPEIEACILKLEGTDEKGFIKNKELKADNVLFRHSMKKFPCLEDSFYIRIKAEKKAGKGYECSFIGKEPENDEFVYLKDYFKGLGSDVSYITDIDEIADAFDFFEVYSDSTISLWALNSFTKELDNALRRHVYLKNEANIVIDTTEALVAVDVNTGRGKAKDLLETNKLAVKELARQLRLRSLSGIIVVDLLKPMNDKEREEVLQCFIGAAKDDPNLIQAHGFTSLGLLEITRSKGLSPLNEIYKKYTIN